MKEHLKKVLSNHSSVLSGVTCETRLAVLINKIKMYSKSAINAPVAIIPPIPKVMMHAHTRQHAKLTKFFSADLSSKQKKKHTAGNRTKMPKIIASLISAAP